MKHDLRKRLALTVAAAAILMLPAASLADTLVTKAADPTEQGDGTMSAAARNAMLRGALPKSAGEVAAKAGITAASAQAAGALGPVGASGGPLAAISGGHNFDGQFDPGVAPPDTTGAIGTTRYIQLVNKRFGIYNRTTNALISSGTLNTLAGLAANVNTFDPQIIWDAQTNRFFYVNDSIFSASDNRLSWGFSKTSSPSDGSSTHWCKYTTGFGSRFPDYPKLGDSFYFFIVGVNSFAPSFVGSDIISFSKPAAGTTCPLGSSFKINRILDIRDTSGNQIFTPTPSNQIDPNATGYVIARNGGLPSNRLWFRNVTRNAGTGFAIYGGPRAVTVAVYTFPPDSPAGATGGRFVDTLDARPTQAVQSVNPDRGAIQSFWTQHTINVSGRAAVRWYEINPAPAVPVLLRQGNISHASSHLFNAAISSDRKVRTGSASQFGDSFVIHYSVTQRNPGGINPRIVAGSSFNGGAVGTFVTLQNSPGPDVDFTCPGSTSTCRWGDYAGANPDPLPPAGNRGVVWGANQWVSGGTSTATSNWRTKIFALTP